MGKSRNKNKDIDKSSASYGRRKDRNDDAFSDSDESVSTHITFDDDLQSVRGDLEDDEEIVIDSLGEYIENASNKNIRTRSSGLKNLIFAFTSQYRPDIIEKWRTTLVDITTRGLRKTDDEIVLSATLLALLALQGGDEISCDIGEALTTLRCIVTDETKPEQVRARCALSLSIITFISCEEDDETAHSLKALRSAWITTKLSSSMSTLFDTALSGWALLLQNATSDLVLSAFADQPKLVTYLEASTLEIRVAAGEVLAFLYEFAGEYSSSITFPNHQHVQQILVSLIRDCTKSKAKKDKRIQKFSFRQVQAFIDGEEFPLLKIRFSSCECLELNSCASKLLYNLCTDLLHGGMMQQLKNNALLREMFELGAPVPAVITQDRINKAHRLAVHEAATKYRNLERAKHRNKRADFS